MWCSPSDRLEVVQSCVRASPQCSDAEVSATMTPAGRKSQRAGLRPKADGRHERSRLLAGASCARALSPARPARISLGPPAETELTDQPAAITALNPRKRRCVRLHLSS